MRRLIISSILVLILSPLPVFAEAPKLQDNVPNRYVVVPGDTLWGIAGRFLKNPWKWPELWGENREEIQNPHLIYPGDVIVLDTSGGTPHLRVLSSSQVSSDGGAPPNLETVRLSPGIQTRDLGRAIPSIPISAIAPFLNNTRIVEEKSWNEAPKVVSGDNYDYILGAGSSAFVEGLPSGSIVRWDIFRKGRKIFDPDSGKLLGVQVDYCGEGRVTKFDHPSRIDIVKSTREIDVGDRLYPTVDSLITHYIPHSPDTQVKGRILSADGKTTQIGQNDVVLLNIGTQDGIELGDVLAVYRKGKDIMSGRKVDVTLPDDRIGLVLVFRAYEHVSYALVMQSKDTISASDTVKTP